jgi:hypothetical protein
MAYSRRKWWKFLSFLFAGIFFLLDFIGRIQTVLEVISVLQVWIPVLRHFGLPSHIFAWIGLVCILIGIVSFVWPEDEKSAVTGPELWLDYRFSTLTTKDLALTNNHGGMAANIQIDQMESDNMICSVDLVRSLRPGETVLLKTRVRQKQQAIIPAENLDSFLTTAVSKPIAVKMFYENGNGDHFQAEFEMRYRMPQHEVLVTRKSIERS